MLFLPTQIADSCSHPKLWIFGRKCAYQRDYTLFFHSLICVPRMDLYFMVSYLFPAIFSRKLPLQSTALSLSLSPFPTCCKLTFATWRLNLAVLARIDLLIIFERCLQELKSFHLSQCGIGNITSCVFNQITAFTSNHHRNTKRDQNVFTSK